MGWIRCVCWVKLQRDFVARTFALISPVQYVLHQVSCSYETIPKHPNTMKRTETLVLGPMGWIGSVRCEKSRCDFVVRTFAFIAPFHPVLHRVSWSYETIPNAHKHYETHQNMRLGSNGVDQVHSLRKITTWLPGTNFCINWTSLICFATSFMQLWNLPTWLRRANFCITCSSSPRFAPSFKQLRNDPKYTQILWNGPKH